MFRLRRKTRRPLRFYVISETPTLAEAPRARANAAPARRHARASRRISLCAALFAIVGAGLISRLAVVSAGAVNGPFGRSNGSVTAGAERAEILDRNGALLAANLPMTALVIAGSEVWSPTETAHELSQLFPEIDAAALSADLARKRHREVLSDLTPAQRKAVFALGLPVVHFKEDTKRFYPQERLAAHVVGHMEEGKGGAAGLEAVLDGLPANRALVASIDIRAQQALQEELARGMIEYRAAAAWGAVMDVDTGEVIALASLPDFDPNQPGAASPDARRNRAVYDRYELGSAFKPLIAAAALEAGIADEASMYDARAPFRVADRVIDDFHPKRRFLSFEEVLMYSSNIGMARMAGELGAERERAALKALGMLDTLPIELNERRRPDPPLRWGAVETATIAFGHGIAVTPLHLLSAFCAVVNGGRWRAPTFLKADAATPGSAAFSKETSARMRPILRRVLTDGTAKSADVESYAPIGKTGTAEKPGVGGYKKDKLITSLIGAFPGDKPRYAVLVSFDEPRPTPTSFGYATAGYNAGPTFARVVARIAPALGVMPIANAEEFAAVATGGSSRKEGAL